MYTFTIREIQDYLSSQRTPLWFGMLHMHIADAKLDKDHLTYIDIISAMGHKGAAHLLELFNRDEDGRARLDEYYRVLYTHYTHFASDRTQSNLAPMRVSRAMYLEMSIQYARGDHDYMRETIRTRFFDRDLLIVTQTLKSLKLYHEAQVADACKSLIHSIVDLSISDTSEVESVSLPAVNSLSKVILT